MSSNSIEARLPCTATACASKSAFRSSLVSLKYVYSQLASSWPTSRRWESLLPISNGHETKRAKPGARVDRVKLRQIDRDGTTCVTSAPAGCLSTRSTSAPSC